MDRVDDVVECVDLGGPPVVMPHLNGGVTLQAGLGSFVLQDIRIAKIFDMRRLVLAHEGLRVHEHLDLDPAGEGIRVLPDDRLGGRATRVQRELGRHRLELLLRDRLTVGIGQRGV